MLRTAPVDRLSLRRVAEHVGVSHQAAYVQFGSRRRLLAVVAGVGLDRAAEAAERSVAAAGESPIARLWALARAYAEWVTPEPPHVHDRSTSPDANGKNPRTPWDAVLQRGH